MKTSRAAAPRGREVDHLTVEDVAELYRDHTLDVLKVRRGLPGDYLRSLTDRFWAAPPRRRQPPAAGVEIGTHHFGQDLDHYLAEAEASAAELDAVIGPPEANPLDGFRAELAGHLADIGLAFRLANHEGRAAAPAIVRSWSSEFADGDFDLGPHDDVAQLRHANQAGFEVQQVRPEDLIAVNICAARRSGGELIVWGVRGTEAVRRQLDISDHGYPYPTAWLDAQPRLRMTMDVGDVIFLRGQLVHAITRSPDRVVVSFFTGRVSSGSGTDVVYWS